MNHEGVEKLLQDKFTLGADASVAAGPVGRTVSAATDAQLTAQILSYARSKGLFAGVALEGAVMRASGDDNEKLYGREVSARDLLISGTIPPPASAAPLLQLLEQATGSGSIASAGAGDPGTQVGEGTITGTVRDTTGANIPDAVVTIRNLNTGLGRTLHTDPAGQYVAEGLPAGTYQIRAESPGLLPVTADPLPLAGGAGESMHFTLKPIR